jgi:NADH:ubiquinone oxidoreductase subunit
VRCWANLWRVMGEDEVASLDLIVAGEAAFHGRRSRRFAVYEGSESPAACRSVFRGVFNHKLNVRGGPGTKDWAWPKTLLLPPTGRDRSAERQ